MFVPLVLFLVFGGQAALADKFKFNFTAVHQCEPVSISFSGSENAKAIPSSLTLIPFGSKPFSIPLPSNSTNATGVTVSFLPLSEGTQFIASLDDDDGDNSSRVSDIFRVFPSETGDASCLPSVTGTPLFTLPTSVTQCQPFNVAYTTAAPPNLRVFFPRGGAFQLGIIDTPSPGLATYMMNVTRQASVILMAFDDNIQNGVTSPLLTVLGDASSSNTCFVPQNNNSKSNDKIKDGARAKSSVSNAVAIGLGVGGGVVVLATILLAAFLIRRKYRRRGARNLDFNPALLEKRSSYAKSDYSGSQIGQIAQNLNYSPYSPSTSVVQNPPYTANRFSSRSSEGYPVSTWRETPRLPQPIAQAQPSTTPSYDIEQMLNMVAETNDSEEFQRAMPPEEPVITIVEPPTKPEPPRIVTTVGRHAAQPSGVPISAAYDSLTPIGGTPRESFADSVNFEMVSRPPAASLAPSVASPGLTVPSSRFSDPSFIDGGSIGDFPKPPFSSHVLVRDSNDSWGNLGSGR